MKYEVAADSFIAAIEQLMGQYLRASDGNVTSYDLSGDEFSVKIRIKPKKPARVAPSEGGTEL